MLIKDRFLIQKKIIALLAITGCCGGLFLAVTDRLRPEVSLLESTAVFFLTLLAGLIIGTAAEALYKTNKNLFLTKNKNGDFIFGRQRLFLLFLVAAWVTWRMTEGMETKYRIIYAAMVSVLFIVSLAAGIYNQFGPGAGRMMLAGMIPLSGSILYLIIGVSGEIRTIIWVFGLTYLLCSFVIMNNIQLIDNVLGVKNINIKSVKRIRTYNYVMSGFLTVVCILFIFFRRVLLLAGDFIRNVLSVIYSWIVRFSKWITYDHWYRGIADPQADEPRVWEQSDMPFDIVRFFLVLAVLVVILAVLIFVIRNISKEKNNRPKGMKVIKDAEYIEENEIVKDKPALRKRKKPRYTAEGLKHLEEPSQKIRYLYGMILERFYLRKIKIRKSDTPVEILSKIKNSKNSKKVLAAGFDEFTETYRKVRYGGMEVSIPKDMTKLADEYEKAISDIKDDESTD